MYSTSPVLFSPVWLRSVIPEKAFQIEETGWSAFPFGRSTLHSRILNYERVSVTVDTLIREDDGTTENAHGLAPDELAVRELGLSLINFISLFLSCLMSHYILEYYRNGRYRGGLESVLSKHSWRGSRVFRKSAHGPRAAQRQLVRRHLEKPSEENVLWTMPLPSQ